MGYTETLHADLYCNVYRQLEHMHYKHVHGMVYTSLHQYTDHTCSLQLKHIAIDEVTGIFCKPFSWKP